MTFALLSSLAVGTSPATAAESAPKSQDQPSSTWAHPGTTPLDGLGTFVYLAAPPAGATQGSLLGYEYTLTYRFQDGSMGLLALGAQQGRRVAGFGLIPGHTVTTVPFAWSFGHVYFLYTKRLDATQWAAWVLDYSTSTWTFIGVQAAPAGAGGIAPASTTTRVDYDPTLAPAPAADQSTCTFYPRVDVYFFAPIGWRGAAMSIANLAGNSVSKGDCPSTTSSLSPWQHYRLGTTAP